MYVLVAVFWQKELSSKQRVHKKYPREGIKALKEISSSGRRVLDRVAFLPIKYARSQVDSRIPVDILGVALKERTTRRLQIANVLIF